MKTDFEPEVEARTPSVPVRRRVRRWLRRALRPLCMAGVAGALALSLTVTTTVKAEATPAVAVLPVIAAAEAVLGGGVAISMPSLLATSLAVHPVGWAIAAAIAIGVGAYATQDYWLPYVKGEWGKATNADTPAPDGTANIDTRVTLKTMTNDPNAGNRIVITGSTLAPTTQGDTYFHVSAHLYCNGKADGTGAAQPDTVVAPLSAYSIGSSRTFTMQTFCDSGYVVGAIVGARLASPELTASNSGGGPTNVLRWGNTVTASQGFDPSSPDAKYRAEVECVAADGTKSLISAISTGDVGAIKMPSCEAAGKGHGTGAYKIYGTPPGTTIEGTQPLETQAAPAADPSRPLCDPAKGGAPCKLGVQLDGKPCTIGSFECMNWSSLKNDPNWSTRLSCQYGIYAVPMASCNPLERAYELGGAPATDANTDGNPDTRSDTDATGQPQPKTQAPPSTGTLPTTGTNPGSNPGEEGQNCFAQGWSWNPVSWVMVPVQCALQWAFVPPRLKIDTALATITPRLEARGIQPFITPVVAGVSGLGGGGCSGPAIDLSVIHLPTFYPFSACEAPMSTIATGVSAFFGLSIIIQGGMSCIRGAAAAFGFNWGLGSKSEESA